MPNFILTRRSVIICPHGGAVTHIPTTYTSYRVNGEMPLLLGDQYLVTGCGNFAGGSLSPCVSVTWTSASPFLIICGRPALVHTSVGLCMAAGGASQGPAIVTSFQTTEPEPTEITIINC